MFDLGKITVTSSRAVLGMDGYGVPAQRIDPSSHALLADMVLPVLSPEGVVTWVFDVTEDNIKMVKSRFHMVKGYSVSMQINPIQNPFRNQKEQEELNTAHVKKLADLRKKEDKMKQDLARMQGALKKQEEALVTLEMEHQEKVKTAALKDGKATKVKPSKELAEKRKIFTDGKEKVEDVTTKLTLLQQEIRSV